MILSLFRNHVLPETPALFLVLTFMIEVSAKFYRMVLLVRKKSHARPQFQNFKIPFCALSHEIANLFSVGSQTYKTATPAAAFWSMNVPSTFATKFATSERQIPFNANSLKDL
jgi:hypothetical protein